jgi:Mn2+/Fe2+ NRAMP family transporter
MQDEAVSFCQSLHRKPKAAKVFYAVYGGLVALAAALVPAPRTPVGLLTNSVRSLAGVLLPSATAFLWLLCNDMAVLGPWVNGRWLNLFTGAVIAVLVMLSIILTASVLDSAYRYVVNTSYNLARKPVAVLCVQVCAENVTEPP